MDPLKPKNVCFRKSLNEISPPNPYVDYFELNVCPNFKNFSVKECLLIIVITFFALIFSIFYDFLEPINNYAKFFLEINAQLDLSR